MDLADTEMLVIDAGPSAKFLLGALRKIQKLSGHARASLKQIFKDLEQMLKRSKRTGGVIVR